MKIKDLEAFDAFMRHGTMQSAARTLGVSQSAISRMLSSLESQVNFDLFYRKKNQLTATAQAELFHKTVERMLSNYQEVQATATAISKQQVGDLTIAASPIFCDTFILDAVAAFKKTHPQVAVKVYDVGMTDLLAMVRHGRCDLGIGITLGMDQTDALVTRLGHCEARCIMPKGYHADKGYAVPLADLADATFVDLMLGTPLRTRIDALFEDVHAQRHVAVEMRHLSGVVALVERGVGVAIVDPLAEISMDLEKVTSRRIKPSIAWELALYQSQEQPLTDVAHAFCSELDRQIQVLKGRGIVLQ